MIIFILYYKIDFFKEDEKYFLFNYFGLTFSFCVRFFNIRFFINFRIYKK